jgi:hypothetical protein
VSKRKRVEWIPRNVQTAEPFGLDDGRSTPTSEEDHSSNLQVCLT